MGDAEVGQNSEKASKCSFGAEEESSDQTVQLAITWGQYFGHITCRNVEENIKMCKGTFFLIIHQA